MRTGAHVLYAHTPNANGQWHLLADHLRAVAELVAKYAAPFGGQAAAAWLGWWHDAGKAHPDFQRYLRLCAAQPGTRPPTVDHKGAATLAAHGTKDLLAFIAHGHHGGLSDKEALIARSHDLTSGQPGERARTVLEQLKVEQLIPLDASASVDFPDWVTRGDPLTVEMFIRMLFSALVDADHFDTERHRRPEAAVLRTAEGHLAPLFEQLPASQAALSGTQTDALGAIRHAVYQRCLDRASEPPGFFRLSAPTGAGKTRSAMAFALAHALKHGMQRVIMVSPYLTITDQTADVYREIFGEGVVLEHHSDAGRHDDPEGAQSMYAERRRPTSETWEASIIWPNWRDRRGRDHGVHVAERSRVSGQVERNGRPGSGDRRRCHSRR